MEGEFPGCRFWSKPVGFKSGGRRGWDVKPVGLWNQGGFAEQRRANRQTGSICLGRGGDERALETSHRGGCFSLQAKYLPAQ